MAADQRNEGGSMAREEERGCDAVMLNTGRALRQGTQGTSGSPLEHCQASTRCGLQLNNGGAA